MKQEQAKRIRLIYGIVLGAAAVAAGVCLIVACWGIYRSGGDQVYTPQKAAQAFSAIALPVYLCLALVLGGFILDIALPFAPEKAKREKNRTAILKLLHTKADLSAADPALCSAIAAQPKLRRLHRSISLVLLCLGAAVFLAYGLNSGNFDSKDITGSVIRAVWLLLPCMAVPFGYGIFAAYYSRNSMDREIALLKQVGTYEGKPCRAAAAPSGKWELPLRLGLLALAIGLAVYGFTAGGWADVLTKAVNICTECVGLG